MVTLKNRSLCVGKELTYTMHCWENRKNIHNMCFAKKKVNHIDAHTDIYAFCNYCK